MVKDIVPELNEQIEAKFKGNVLADRQLRTVSQRITSGRAQPGDAHRYAERLGEDLSNALTGTLTAENLPNGKLYFNIAERTVIPALEQNYEMVNEAAAMIQKSIDQKAKIGLGSVKADFPTERIQNLIDKLTADDITPEAVIRWLTEPIINNSEAFADDYVEANAKFRSRAGLRTKLIRKAEAKCCDWCAALEGSYDYDDAPDDIYRRHEFCRCTVTFKTEKISQGVWSKREWNTPKEDLEIRQQAGQRQELSVDERLDQIERLRRDEKIKKYMTETGYDRETARKSTRNKSPAEIDAEIQKIKERRQTTNRR